MSWMQQTPSTLHRNTGNIVISKYFDVAKKTFAIKVLDLYHCTSILDAPGPLQQPAQTRFSVWAILEPKVGTMCAKQNRSQRQKIPMISAPSHLLESIDASVSENRTECECEL
jgi:hypothetical protein